MRSRTAVAVGTTVLVAGLVVGGGWAAVATQLPAPAPSPTGTAARPAVVGAPKRLPTAVAPPAATRTPAPVAAAAVRRTCSVAAAARDPRLHRFQGRVVDARTGEVLLDRDGSRASRAASVMKVLTSAAALRALGPDHRFTTRVVEGRRAGEVVLVGGGDVTLSRTPVGSTTAYAGAPHLATLAARTRAAWRSAHPGRPITRIVLDASAWGGPTWHPTWDAKERRLGSTSRMTALMVDGDRATPAARTSPRGEDPVGRAGAAFASSFPGATVVRGTAPAGARRLALVRSQPVSRLVGQTLLYSDNTLAEALARAVAIRAGAGNTFASMDQPVRAALAGYGVAPKKVRVVDGSGLSDDDRIAPAYLTRLLRLVWRKADGLRPLYDGLPVAGRTGSLSYPDRFAGAASRADGKVRAKTGWIDTGYTLAGIIRAKDDTPLTFAFYALGDDDPPSMKTALDELTADVWSCGKRLSDR